MKNELLSDLGQYLVEGSLSDARVLEKTGREPPLAILPKAHVIKIGGQSFIDRGRVAVFPLLEELVANLGRHDMIIGTGGGSRARHAYSVADLRGCPPAC
jgi:molybdenum storage protein